MGRPGDRSPGVPIYGPRLANLSISFPYRARMKELVIAFPVIAGRPMFG